MTASDIFYADLMALCHKDPQLLTASDIRLLQRHSLKTLTPDNLVMNVIYSYAVRSNAGMEKFGQSMGDHKADQEHWLRNLQEELQDATLYIERARADHAG
jgi:hypothetical protein